MSIPSELSHKLEEGAALQMNCF